MIHILLPCNFYCVFYVRNDVNLDFYFRNPVVIFNYMIKFEDWSEVKEI